MVHLAQKPPTTPTLDDDRRWVEPHDRHLLPPPHRTAHAHIQEEIIANLELVFADAGYTITIITTLEQETQRQHAQPLMHEPDLALLADTPIRNIIARRSERDLHDEHRITRNTATRLVSLLDTAKQTTSTKILTRQKRARRTSQNHEQELHHTHEQHELERRRTRTTDHGRAEQRKSEREHKQPHGTLPPTLDEPGLLPDTHASFHPRSRFRRRS